MAVGMAVKNSLMVAIPASYGHVQRRYNHSTNLRVSADYNKESVGTLFM